MKKVPFFSVPVESKIKLTFWPKSRKNKILQSLVYLEYCLHLYPYRNTMTGIGIVATLTAAKTVNAHPTPNRSDKGCTPSGMNVPKTHLVKITAVTADAE